MDARALLLTWLLCAVATPCTAAGIQTRNDAAAFIRETAVLDQVAHAEKIDRSALQAQLKQTRLAYKRVEYLLEYYYPEHIKAYINGPPLRHLDPYPFEEMPFPEGYYSDPSFINIAPLDYQEPNANRKPREVVEPQGLQALDELIFSDGEIEPARVRFLTSELVKRSRIGVQALLKRRYIEDYQIMEAARLEIVRIFTLGITGFDTPGSLNALDEAAAVLAALAPMIDSIVHKSEIQQLFTTSARMLKDQSFDRFDRLGFLTRVLNPLYRALQQAHKELRLKNSRDLTYEIPTWSSDSENIFGNDFLNPYAYTLLTAKQDSEALRALGRKIFFDAQLSGDGSKSCSSCHRPELAFTDGAPKSIRRNAPSLINAVFADRFFYDLRALSLEEQITNVVEDPTEFNTSLDDVTAKINARSDYSVTKPITRYQVLSALASYVVSLRSFNSPFDQYVRGETSKIDPAVVEGFNLFMGKAACGTCHYAPTFSGLVPPLFRESESEVLGVLQKPDASVLDPDHGRAANKHFQEDAPIFDHAFKTVTVRNIELTAPYFHNGAYQTLDEVIDFYDKGGAQGMGLSDAAPYQTLSPQPLQLTSKEKASLKAFLLSLTDRSAIQPP